MNFPNLSGGLDCGKPPCVEHGGLCAFHGTEPDRCRWCHSTWAQILSTGYHSCESSSVWTNGKRPDNAEYVAGRIGQAAKMRRRAAEEASLRPFRGWQSGPCSHGGGSTPLDSEASAKAQNAPEGVVP